MSCSSAGLGLWRLGLHARLPLSREQRRLRRLLRLLSISIFEAPMSSTSVMSSSSEFEIAVSLWPHSCPTRRRHSSGMLLCHVRCSLSFASILARSSDTELRTTFWRPSCSRLSCSLDSSSCSLCADRCSSSASLSRASASACRSSLLCATLFSCSDCVPRPSPRERACFACSSRAACMLAKRGSTSSKPAATSAWCCSHLSWRASIRASLRAPQSFRPPARADMHCSTAAAVSAWLCWADCRCLASMSATSADVRSSKRELTRELTRCSTPSSPAASAPWTSLLSVLRSSSWPSMRVCSAEACPETASRTSP
mmetsp:Transcript_55660/g.156739  ORF Transcript_55660/g.156739 Transcript_55660/m.156739 type:complete len:313 (-) Transcript_55660:953-1891(-)